MPNAQEYNALVDEVGRFRTALSELVSAASCWSQCADVARGEDRAQCAANQFQALEAARAVLRE